MTKLLIVLLSVVLLTGCFGSTRYHPDPFPNNADLESVDYPMRNGDSDSALGDAYLRALGELEKANSRLEGVREAKEKYLELIED